jgi:hypothetical protein
MQELEMMQQADALLKKMGFKNSLLDAPEKSQGGEGAEETSSSSSSGAGGQ